MRGSGRGATTSGEANGVRRIARRRESSSGSWVLSESDSGGFEGDFGGSGGFRFGHGRLRLELYVVQRYVGAFGSEMRKGVSCLVAKGVPRSSVVYHWNCLFIEYSLSRRVERVTTVSAMGFRWFQPEYMRIWGCVHNSR